MARSNSKRVANAQPAQSSSFYNFNQGNLETFSPQSSEVNTNISEGTFEDDMPSCHLEQAVHPDFGVDINHPFNMDFEPFGEFPVNEEPAQPVTTARDMALRAYGNSVVIDTPLCRRLAEITGIRVPEQRKSDQVLNLARRGNVEALLCHTAGEPALEPCRNCRKGHGPWTICVRLQGQMLGACTNCWFNASGARCQYHESQNPESEHPATRARRSNPPSPADTVATPVDVQLQRFSSPASIQMQNSSASAALVQPGIPAKYANIYTDAIQQCSQLNQNEWHKMSIHAAALQLGLNIRRSELWEQEGTTERDLQRIANQAQEQIDQQRSLPGPSSKMRMATDFE